MDAHARIADLRGWPQPKAADKATDQWRSAWAEVERFAQRHPQSMRRFFIESNWIDDLANTLSPETKSKMYFVPQQHNWRTRDDN